MRTQPRSWLEMDCNYGCGETIWVDTDDYAQIKSEDGRYPRRLVHEWLGKHVLDALVEHHARCSEFYELPGGRPWLRLVAEETQQ